MTVTTIISGIKFETYATAKGATMARTIGARRSLFTFPTLDAALTFHASQH